MLVKCFFLPEHQFDADGQHVEVLQHFVAQSLYHSQAHGIFLRGDDALGRGELAERLVDQADILLLELMMVGKGQRADILGISLEILSHLFGRGDACEQEGVVGG